VRPASQARPVAESYNSLQNIKAAGYPQTIAHMAWIDLQQRGDIGGKHTSGSCTSRVANHHMCSAVHRGQRQLITSSSYSGRMSVSSVHRPSADSYHELSRMTQLAWPPRVVPDRRP
jgi:hypothetical protein